MEFKKGYILALTAGIAILLTGCGSGSGMSKSAEAPTQNFLAAGSADNAYYAEEAYYDTEYATDDYNTADGWGNGGDIPTAFHETSNRKLIRTVNLDVETKTYEELMDTVERMVLDMGGYIESMDSNNGSIYSSYRKTRNANLTLRIPKEHVNEFLEFVEGKANVLRRTENVEDVTLNYTDLESRKQALKTEYDRLLAILEKAEQLDEIIMLEDRLSNVRYEMERIESSLRGYDNKVDYGTVYLSISEVEELTPVVEETVTERMKKGFENTIEEITVELQDFAISVVTNSPYIVILLVCAIVYVIVLLVLFKIIYTIIKKKAKKAKPNGEEKK